MFIETTTKENGVSITFETPFSFVDIKSTYLAGVAAALLILLVHSMEMALFSILI